MVQTLPYSRGQMLAEEAWGDRPIPKEKGRKAVYRQKAGRWARR
jgi:hypothetical protein